MLQRNLVKEGHHVLIFSQTRKMLNLIQVHCCCFNSFSLHPLSTFAHDTCDFANGDYISSSLIHCRLRTLIFFGPFVTQISVHMDRLHNWTMTYMASYQRHMVLLSHLYTT